MITRARVALKFLAYGLVAGLLMAPRSGRESRELLKRRLTETVRATIGRLRARL